MGATKRAAIVSPAVAPAVKRFAKSAGLRVRDLAGGRLAVLLPTDVVEVLKLQHRWHHKAGGACLTWGPDRRPRVGLCPAAPDFVGGCLEVPGGGPGHGGGRDGKLA
jgi:hypothetical protein